MDISQALRTAKFRMPTFIFSALGFGIASIIGVLFLYIYIQGIAPIFINLIDNLQGLQRLLLAILLLILGLMLTGAITGGIGGYILSLIDPQARRKRYIVSAAIAFGIPHLLVTTTMLLLLATIAIYNNNMDTNIQHLGILFMLFGLLYGLLSGLLLGLLSVGFKQGLKVLLFSVLGGSLGGLSFGLIARVIIQAANGHIKNYNLSLLLLAIFLFFAILGGFLGKAYKNIAKKQKEGKLTFEIHAGWKILTVIIILAIFIPLITTVSQLFQFIEFNPKETANYIPLQTITTNWTEPIVVSKGKILTNASSQNSQVKINGTTAITFTDSQGKTHAVWHGTEIEKVTGAKTTGHYLFEAVQSKDKTWSAPILITQTDGPVNPTVITDLNGTTHLLWTDQNRQTHYSKKNEIICQNREYPKPIQSIIDIYNSGKYRPATDPSTYCNNSYIGLEYLPSQIIPDSKELELKPYGAYDDIADSVESAKYEVSFATMQWMTDLNNDSPGYIMAEAITNLYEKVKNNPENYPRGMTVQILLGNYPEVATLKWGDQIWDVMDVLKKAGLPEFINEELGWKVEITNYSGSFPHSHTKLLVVDGETVTSAGYNYSYFHLPEIYGLQDAVSLFDIGMQVKGPVAQTALMAYDDMWQGSDQLICPNNLLRGDSAPQYCKFVKAEVSHVPEVLLFAPQNNSDIAFSLYRTPNYLEADDAILAAIRSAEHTIDLYEVNFSLKAYCVLGAFIDGFCGYDDATPYIKAIAKTIIENDVKVRLITTDVNMNGIENKVGMQVLSDELEKRGKLENVEFRYYTGRIHPKSFLVDGELLFIGSQNFHYSAWESGLLEYNLATDSEDAISEYKETYEYYWNESIPINEAGRVKIE